MTEAEQSQSDRQNEVTALLSSATLVLVGGILKAAISLVERVFLGRALSPNLYGEISMAIAILSVSATVSLIGFSQGIPRFMSRFDREEDVRGVFLTGFFWAIGAAVLLSLTLVAVSDIVVLHFFDTDYADDVFMLFALTVPFSAGMGICIGGIRGSENTIYKTYVSDLLYPGGRILVMVALVALGLGPLAAGYAYLTMAALSFFVAILLLNRLVPIVGRFNPRSKEMLQFSAPLMISSLITGLFLRTDTMMVGYFSTSHAVGLYSAAFPLATGLLVVFTSFGFLYLPLASRLDSNGEREEVRRIYRLTTKWIFVVTFPAFLMLFVFPDDTINIFFGKQYEEAATALSILSIGFFTNAGVGRNRETLSALGYPEYILGVNSTAFALNLALNLLLIPRYGIVGAAVASTTANVTLNVLVVAALYWTCDITPFSKWTTRTFTRLPVLLIPPTILIAEVVSLNVFTFPVFLVGSAVATLAVFFSTGCIESDDEILLEFVESALGAELPFVRRLFPSSE